MNLDSTMLPVTVTTIRVPLDELFTGDVIHFWTTDKYVTREYHALKVPVYNDYETALDHFQIGIHASGTVVSVYDLVRHSELGWIERATKMNKTYHRHLFRLTIVNTVEHGPVPFEPGSHVQINPREGGAEK